MAEQYSIVWKYCTFLFIIVNIWAAYTHIIIPYIINNAAYNPSTSEAETWISGYRELQCESLS